MAKLKPEIKKLWVDALRSGEYKQGIEHLELEGRYCCLGVCTVLVDGPHALDREDEVPSVTYAREWWEELPDIPSHANNPLVKATVPTEYDDETGEDISMSEKYVSLATLNDEYKFTFDQIADLIEEQL